MKTIDIKRTFEKTFNFQKNPLTPEVIGYYETDNHIVELSHGSGLFFPDLFGVTVLHKDGSKTDLGTAFNEKQKALDYMKTL